MKRKDFLKYFIIGAITVFICLIMTIESKAYDDSEGEPMDISQYGSAAELYNALSAALSIEELEGREENIKSLLAGKKSKEQVYLAHQDLSVSLKRIVFVRNRIREFQKMYVEQIFVPVKAAGPNRSVGKDGSMSFSGTNTAIASYIINKYAKGQPGVTSRDIEESAKRISATPGNHAKKGFSITFNNTIPNDKLGGPNTVIPMQVALRNGDTHFIEWTLSRTSKPTYAQDNNNPEIEFVVYKDSYNYVENRENIGSWWGFNNKKSNAFGCAVKTYQEIENLETGVITSFMQDVLDVDFQLRENRSYHRKVTEYLPGEYTRSYEEIVHVKDFYSSANEDGDIVYMPQVLEIEHFNDSHAPGLVTTSFQSYQYDEYDRASEILNISHVESKDGKVSYNTISISKILEYDPLTKLATLESIDFSLQLGEGSLKDAIQYGQVMWHAFKDEEIARVLSDITSESFANVIKDIAEQVMVQNIDYKAARTNALAPYWAGAGNVAQTQSISTLGIEVYVDI